MSHEYKISGLITIDLLQISLYVFGFIALDGTVTEKLE